MFEVIVNGDVVLESEDKNQYSKVSFNTKIVESGIEVTIRLNCVSYSFVLDSNRKYLYQNEETYEKDFITSADEIINVFKKISGNMESYLNNDLIVIEIDKSSVYFSLNLGGIRDLESDDIEYSDELIMLP